MYNLNVQVFIGLGNPTSKYKNTRHNAGFIILDNFVHELNLTWQYNKDFDADVLEYQGKLLVKPHTYMNNSGKSVSKVVNYFKVKLDDLIVIHDEVDLPFGRIKKQFGASSAGHRGVADIIEALGTSDFWRIRVGVGRPEISKIPTEDWVLMNFTESELNTINSLTLLKEYF